MMAVAIPKKAEMPLYNQAQFALPQPRISRDRPDSRLSFERQILGRRSIEARRLSPVTSSEYMQVGSRYSIKSSIELEPLTATTRFSQTSGMEYSSHFGQSHKDRYPSPTNNKPSFPIINNNNTVVYSHPSNQINHNSILKQQSNQTQKLSNQPTIPDRKRSRNCTNQVYSNFELGLPPISDEVMDAPKKHASRFSTSPGRPARSRITRPPVPRIPEFFNSGRPSLDHFRPKKRLANSTTMEASGVSFLNKISTPGDVVIQSKGKQSFSSLRKIMGGGGGYQTAKFRLATTSPDSYVDQGQKYSGFAQHHRHRMGAKTPPMPVTIEIAPYEYAAEIVPSHIRIHKEEELSHHRHHRDTLLLRGSWVDFAKCSEEVESAKNGKSKTWWSRLLPKKKSSTRTSPLASLSEDKAIGQKRVHTPSIPEGRLSLMDFFKDEMEQSCARQLEDQRIVPPPPRLPSKMKQSNDDITQKTVGSSILYLDETLNRPAVVHCASPEQLSSTISVKVNDVPQVAPLQLNDKQVVPVMTQDLAIDSPATIAFPRTPMTEDHMFDSSFTSTMDATDVLYDLLSQFKNESSPSTINTNSQVTNRSRPVPSSIMLPEFEMVTPQNLQRTTATTSTSARTHSLTNRSSENKLNRATCTTMETIMSYQSSEDSPLSSLIDENMGASRDFTLEADASGGASAFLNDLIDGVQHDITVSTRSVLNSHNKRTFDSSAPPSCFGHHLKPAASHSTMDSAYSGSAWPIRGNASNFRMLGANIVARELKLTDTRRFDDSPCPGGRALKVKREENEKEENYNASFNTDLMVSHVFIPDISLQHSPTPSTRPTNPISVQCDTSAGQTPPKIIVDRPQSDSSLSLSPSKCDDAIIQRASVIRKSSASILDFSSVRTSMDVFGSVVKEGKRCRISSMKSKANVTLPAAIPLPQIDYWDSYASPVSSKSLSQSPNLSNSFAWSGKRFSSSTGYTVPSPIPRDGSASNKSSFGADVFISQSKFEHHDECSIISEDIASMRNALGLLRESKNRFPDTTYSRSIMDTFIVPQTAQEIKQFLHQSRIAFVPLNHESLPSPDLQVVEIVEGRDPYNGKRWTQKHKIGRTSKRHLMKRMRSSNNGDNSTTLSFGDFSYVSQIKKDHEADTSSGDVDMTAFNSTFHTEDSPRCMNDTSAMTSYSSQPQQSSPLARKNSVLSNQSSDLSEQTLSPDQEEKVNNSNNHVRPNWQQSFNQLWSPPQSMIPLSAAMLDAHGQLTRQESIRPRRLSNIKIVIQSPSTRSSVTSPRSC